ncbi:EamA family transporter [Pseudonocardia eucalypti]|uniref:EamA family transporter n=1 Tax=Pseudonocardia eucalypti TaxID=648755 RepID=A0ABP9RFF6_9PSEU|nr:inner membrane transporter RhtA [Pseudonocardia eucalypti]
MDTETQLREQAPGRAKGIALLLGGALSNQTGAAVGALAFDAIGPVGVVVVRQWVAGVALLVLGRPRLRAFTRRQWWPVLALAAVFATMNLSLYTAVDRIGLGLAVTLEFLGPLAVVVLGARNRATLGCAALAAAGVVLLTRPQPSSDGIGIGLALLAAACWACYILLNRTVGQRVPGLEGTAAAGAVSALGYLPIGLVVLLAHPPTPAALACASAAGLLSSAVPFAVDLLALRRVPAHFFGILMSANPVLAAGIGAVVLGEALVTLDWLGIALVVTANTIAVLVTSRVGTVPA